MGNAKLLKKLETLFWVLGWILLAATILGLGAAVYRHFNPPTLDVLGQSISLPSDSEFQFGTSLKMLLEGFAEAFFAFLVSSIFTMAIHRQPVNLERSERFLLCTCLGWIGTSLMGLVSWVYAIFHYFPSGSVFDVGSAWTSLLTYLSWALSIPTILTPMLYAVTVWILFKQFSHLITFESETV